MIARMRAEKGCPPADNLKRKGATTTTRLDPDLYEQLRAAAFKLRITHNQAITDALRLWLRSQQQGKKP